MKTVKTRYCGYIAMSAIQRKMETEASRNAGAARVLAPGRV